MIRAVEASKASTQVFGFDTKEDMIPVLKEMVKPGDTILVKASHFMEFPKVVEALTK